VRASIRVRVVFEKKMSSAMLPSCKKKDDPKTYTYTCGTETMQGLSEAEKNTQAAQDCTNASLAKNVGKWTCE
jgi:hypothetical protein